MEFLKKNWKEMLEIFIKIIPIIIAVVSLKYTFEVDSKNEKLEKEYKILNTYSMPLNYEVKISKKEGNGKIKFNDREINKGAISITPKIGGIERVYAIHYYKNNVKAIAPVELYSREIENYNAQTLQYKLTEYNIDNIAYTSKYFYGTLYLVIKDYQNNYFINMLVYEIPKDDMTKINTRIYSEIDLLHTYNKQINVLPEFDANQMKEYYILKNKIKEIFKQ